MQYPVEFTADDIMEFDYEYQRWADMVDSRGQFWAVNAELMIVAEEQRLTEFENSSIIVLH